MTYTVAATASRTKQPWAKYRIKRAMAAIDSSSSSSRKSETAYELDLSEPDADGDLCAQSGTAQGGRAKAGLFEQLQLVRQKASVGPECQRHVQSVAAS